MKTEAASAVEIHTEGVSHIKAGLVVRVYDHEELPLGVLIERLIRQLPPGDKLKLARDLMIQSALAKCGTQAAAARMLGISKRAMCYLTNSRKLLPETIE